MMTQEQLQDIFDRLVAGGQVEGWGHALHAEFDVLFARTDEWRRHKHDTQWRRHPDAVQASASKAD